MNKYIVTLEVTPFDDSVVFDEAVVDRALIRALSNIGYDVVRSQIHKEDNKSTEIKTNKNESKKRSSRKVTCSSVSIEEIYETIEEIQLPSRREIFLDDFFG